MSINKKTQCQKEGSQISGQALSQWRGSDLAGFSVTLMPNFLDVPSDRKHGTDSELYFIWKHTNLSVFLVKFWCAVSKYVTYQWQVLEF